MARHHLISAGPQGFSQPAKERLYRGHALGEDPRGTVAAKDGAIRVSYERYDRFGGAFEHLAYSTPFKAYRDRFEQRFRGSGLPDIQSWQQSNSGIMLHGPPPETMARDQQYLRGLSI